jgi:transformer-2 protein
MKSRGFGFVYYDNIEDAKEAKRKCHGMDLDGKNIRVDFSIGERDYAQLPPSRPPPPPPPYSHHGSRSHYHHHHHHTRRHSPYGSPGYHGNRGRERDSPVYSKRYSRSRSRSYDSKQILILFNTLIS